MGLKFKNGGTHWVAMDFFELSFSKEMIRYTKTVLRRIEELG
jgi:hypothetical protein